MRKLQIGVFTSQKNIDEEALKLAYEAGKEIAKADCVLITGGLDGGMEAACKGAKEEKGLTVGILGGEKKEDANKYVDIIIPTGIGFARNFCVALACDGIILVKGGVGALIETSYATYFHIPVIAVEGSGGTADFIGGKTVDEKKCDKVLIAKTPKQAVEKLLKLLG